MSGAIGRSGIPAARAVEWLRVLSETWHAGDVQEQKAEPLHAVYDRIVVKGEEIVQPGSRPRRRPTGWLSRCLRW
jgi:hypothetical protein